MVQEYLSAITNGDKRLIYVCGKIFDYCVKKVATNDDFKFNEHNENTLKFAQLTKEEKEIEARVREKFEHDGIYLAGLDVIDGKIIEINITSPCFFINEINEFDEIIIRQLEKEGRYMEDPVSEKEWVHHDILSYNENEFEDWTTKDFVEYIKYLQDITGLTTKLKGVI